MLELYCQFILLVSVFIINRSINVKAVKTFCDNYLKLNISPIFVRSPFFKDSICNFLLKKSDKVKAKN